MLPKTMLEVLILEDGIFDSPNPSRVNFETDTSPEGQLACPILNRN